MAQRRDFSLASLVPNGNLAVIRIIILVARRSAGLLARVVTVASAMAGCSSHSPSEPPAPVIVRAPDIGRGMHVYRAFCASCHDGDDLDAPALDDFEAWDERAFEWEAVLQQHTAQGFLALPLNAPQSEESINDAILYMETRIRVLEEQSRNSQSEDPYHTRVRVPTGDRLGG